ncbi:FlhC family transcriptional regulator [Cupriavidus sp. D384]|uniref:FlhC family transcriptional regulator n=1 Tax=Cupriavidus sp. D384 TaxID=1538095 RepID=UPI00082B89CE|nr:FlhC family transcriptional regulator [Cupriavidus sp. D384]
MQANSPRPIFERFIVPSWVQDRALSANLRISNYVVNAMAVRPDLERVFRVSHSDLFALRSDQTHANKVFCTPFLAFAPALSSVADWRSFIEGGMPTMTMQRLKDSLPNDLSIVERLALESTNRSYVTALYDLLNMSVLAAPLVGISNELAAYLRSIPQHKMDVAISERMVPLFHWRFADEVFWLETHAGRLTRELIAHFLMQASPLHTDRLPHSEPWGNFRLENFVREALLEAFLYFGCRAKSVSSLFNISIDVVREAYRRIHDKASPSGQPPSSLTWFIETAPRRVQSTFQIWLFRSAIASEVSTPESFVATMDINKAFFADDCKVPPERSMHLARSMAMNEELAVWPCRKCGTPYLASNSSAKIELSHSFTCPCCNGTLTATRGGNRRRK